MLILKRRKDESLQLKTSDGNINIQFLETGQQVKIAIEAPDRIKIIRSELLETIIDKQ